MSEVDYAKATLESTVYAPTTRFRWVTPAALAGAPRRLQQCFIGPKGHVWVTIPVIVDPEAFRG